MEECVTRRLQDTLPSIRRELLSRLIAKFEAPAAAPSPPAARRQQMLQRHLARLLGKESAALDAGSDEFAEKMVQSLNAVFDSLNAIVATINTTLLGRKPEMETIRHVIGSSIEGQAGGQTIDGYLDQIQRAFLAAHNAFQEAARAKVGQFMAELDPEKFEAEAEGGLKFGPLRKAELYDAYKDKYATCAKWLASGRFAEELLREFEKICRKQFTAGQGGRT